jgi:hypothetical protein
MLLSPAAKWAWGYLSRLSWATLCLLIFGFTGAAAAANGTISEVDRAVHECAVAASILNFDSSRYYTLCTSAAVAARRAVANSTDPGTRDEYRLKEATSELSAAGAALELEKRSVAMPLLLHSKSVLSDLASTGYSTDVRATSKRLLECFFQGDKAACKLLEKEQ